MQVIKAETVVFRSGLNSKQIDALADALRKKGYSVDTNLLGSHGICHVEIISGKKSAPVAYINGNAIGPVGKSPYHEEINEIANSI